MFIKMYWKKYKFIILPVLYWRVGLEIIRFASQILPLRTGYLGLTAWSNFDGVHYLSIANTGYFQYQEAFFPLYPLLLKLLGILFKPAPVYIPALIISPVFFTLGLIFLYESLPSELQKNYGKLLVIILTFPTAFFFGAIYTESLYFLLTVLVYYFSRREQWIPAALAVSLAGATRVYGIVSMLLLIGCFFKKNQKIKLNFMVALVIAPIGLLSYILYLNWRTGDPLVFFHVQDAFGANRSGSGIVLPPQVAWRYLKIIFTAFLQPTAASYFITICEFISAIYVVIIIIFAWIRKYDRLLLIFSGIILTIPVLTGTLSSFPRYILSAFPVFLMADHVYNQKLRKFMIVSGGVLEIILSMMFFRGYFVS